MAEKNTHSILESIKKKLHKFDQKPENKMADVAAEFDYVAPVKKEEFVVQGDEVVASVTQTPEVVQPAQNSPVEVKPAAKKSGGLEDFDWDDEASVKPVVAQVAASSQTSDYFEEFDEDDLEDYEDEVDFDAEFEEDFAKDEHEEVAPLAVSQQDDELSFGDLEDEKPVQKTENKKEEAMQEDDLNLDDLDFEEIKQEKPAAPTQSVEHNESDKELDELDREIQRQKDEAEEAKKEVHIELEAELLGIKPSHVSEMEIPPVTPVEQLATEEIPLPPEPVKSAPQPEVPLKEVPVEPKVEKVEIEEDFSSFPELPPVQMSAAVEMAPKVESPVAVQRGILIDQNTVKQTTDSVKKLIDAKNIVSGITSFSQSPMLAELAMQMLEPKLEKWLNANLSEMVEKIVREEIKKIIPRE